MKKSIKVEAIRQTSIYDRDLFYLRFTDEGTDKKVIINVGESTYGKVKDLLGEGGTNLGDGLTKAEDKKKEEKKK